MQNENSEILTELKKINEYNGNSKKYGIAFFIFIGIAIFFDVTTEIQLNNEEKKYYENKNKLLESRQQESQVLWQEVQDKLNSDDINGAIEILKESIDNNPDNYYNQGRLAEYYLRAKNYEKALEHYKSAYSLVPHKDYKEIIEIVEKVLEKNS